MKTKTQMAVITGTFYGGHWPTEEARRADPSIGGQEVNIYGLFKNSAAQAYVEQLPAEQREHLWAVHVVPIEFAIEFGKPITPRQVVMGTSFWWHDNKLVPAEEPGDNPWFHSLVKIASGAIQAIHMHNDSYDRESSGYKISQSDACFRVADGDKLQGELLMMLVHSQNDAYDWATNVLYNRLPSQFDYGKDGMEIDPDKVEVTSEGVTL